MDKREKFMNCIQKEIFDRPDLYGENYKDDWEDICDFWETFKSGKSVGGMTENGQKILQYMQENETTQNNLFKAKEIGEGLFMSSRSVSGAMRKLVADGYATKVPGNPVVYSITPLGREMSF